MKQRRLVITETALSDLTDTWLYVAQDSEVKANRLIDKIHDKCQMLALASDIGRPRPELRRGLRSFPVGNFVVFYTVERATIHIVRVLSGYRDLPSLF